MQKAAFSIHSFVANPSLLLGSKRKMRRTPQVGWFWQLKCKHCRAAQRRQKARERAFDELLDKRKDTWAQASSLRFFF